jgi:hypothetical protein
MEDKGSKRTKLSTLSEEERREHDKAVRKAAYARKKAREEEALREYEERKKERHAAVLARNRSEVPAMCAALTLSVEHLRTHIPCVMIPACKRWIADLESKVERREHTGNDSSYDNLPPAFQQLHQAGMEARTRYAKAYNDFTYAKLLDRKLSDAVEVLARMERELLFVQSFPIPDMEMDTMAETATDEEVSDMYHMLNGWVRYMQGMGNSGHSELQAYIEK